MLYLSNPQPDGSEFPLNVKPYSLARRADPLWGTNGKARTYQAAKHAPIALARENLVRFSICFIIALWLSSSSSISVAQVQPQAGSVASNRCAPSWVEIDGNRIWVDKEGSGDWTVVFEAGFGNDSSVWSQIAPIVRTFGVQTFVYDRAGMGKSTINPNTPYSLNHDVHILKTALGACGINRRIIFVGHSYGGAIGLVAASEGKDFGGLVLIDAVVPGVWPKSEVDKNLQAMRSQYAEIREQAPELAKVAIPFAEAMPATAEQVNSVRLPDSLPIIDIVAEKGQHDPESARIWNDAHERFASTPSREHVLAVGSSHKVTADQPALVVKSIQRMIDKLRDK
jgi:pimeloyl-ACP methyl ester carboxylesterase